MDGIYQDGPSGDMRTEDHFFDDISSLGIQAQYSQGGT
jgi:hypothetical protein